MENGIPYTDIDILKALKFKWKGRSDEMIRLKLN